MASDAIETWEKLRSIHKDVKRIQRTLNTMSEDIRAEFDTAVQDVRDTVADESEEVQAVIVLNESDKQALRDQNAALQVALDNARRNALTPDDIATMQAVKQTIENINATDVRTTPVVPTT